MDNMSTWGCLLCGTPLDGGASGLCSKCGPAEITFSDGIPVSTRWYEWDRQSGNRIRDRLRAALQKCGAWVSVKTHTGNGHYSASVESSKQDLLRDLVAVHGLLWRERLRNLPRGEGDAEVTAWRVIGRAICFLEAQEGVHPFLVDIPGGSDPITPEKWAADLVPSKIVEQIAESKVGVRIGVHVRSVADAEHLREVILRLSIDGVSVEPPPSGRRKCSSCDRVTDGLCGHAASCSYCPDRVLGST